MAFNDEAKFEEALIATLTQKGWEKKVLKQPTEKDLLKNWADIIFTNNNMVDRLNGAPLTEGEMAQLLEQIRELRTPQRLNGFINGKTASIRRDNPDDDLHLGKEISLKLFDPHEVAAGQSRYQIVQQPRFASPSPLLQQRRGDMMLLINGMPMIHIEFKKTGVPVSQAYNQIEKYSREGIFTGLFSLIQIFVAMNPEETVYFANPGIDGVFNKDFYFHWADFNNNPLNDWKDIATHLLSIPMAHQLIGYYTIADRSDGVLKVLRSYQYYAVHRISDKVHKHRDWSSTDHQLGGHVWHTTGSGKTMSSFKSALLIADSGDADKVVFVIDRIELGTQSAREYRGFSVTDNDIQETEDTDTFVKKLISTKTADTLIVSSVQKLSIIAEEPRFAEQLKKINRKRIVFIVDECHRSTFGDSFAAIKSAFSTALFFGFTGTPIQVENQRKGCTTVDIFGDELHRYSIADGIRDKNVLGFDPYKILTFPDRAVRIAVGLDQARAETVEEAMGDESKREIFNRFQTMSMAGHDNTDGSYTKGVEDYLPNIQYLTEEHCDSVVQDIIDGWQILSNGGKFHAIFTTSSIPQAIRYYRKFKEMAPWLKVTALFDPSLPNDNPDGVMAKESGLEEIIGDYNTRYNLKFDLAKHHLFKKDLSARLAHKEPYISIGKPEQKEKRLDLLIVVSQMLTGFDSKWVNTLYIDRMLEYADLIQAFSRTNRLFGPEKPFGTIRYYQRPHTMERNIEYAVKTYSGDKPLGLFASKLHVNVGGMNTSFAEIAILFSSAGIDNFSRLPDEIELKGRFAVLFRSYNKFYEAAKVQGFNWNITSYDIPEGGSVELNHTEHQYNTLVQRYKELFTGGGSGGGTTDLPYEIEPHITEIDTSKIDNDYMNRNFQRYVKALTQPNISEQELVDLLNELSTSFTSLSQEEQRFAEILMHDVQSGSITLESGKTFRDYITDYMTTEKDKQVNAVIRIFGLDGDLFKLMFDLHLTEQSLDEFGRFTRLKQSVDKTKAKVYFEKVKGETLSLFKVNIEVHSFLKDILLTGNIDIQDIESAREVTLYPDIEFEPRLVAEDIFVYGSVPVDLPNTKREDLINDKLDLVLMYAIGSSARNKTESAGKIALGIKEDLLGEEQLSAYANVKYLLFHYWNNPRAFVLSSRPTLVNREDVPTDYLLRQEKDAERFLLLEYNPDVIANIGEYNILKTQRRGNIRYMPFVTTLESIKKG